MLADVPAVLGSLDIVFGGRSMSLKKFMMISPKNLNFHRENLKKADEILKRYPKKNKKCCNAFFIFSTKSKIATGYR